MSPTPVVAVTVLGDDRPGIVADVTAALAQLGGNLEDSTMTLLRGHFAMVLLVRTEIEPELIAQTLAPLARGGLTVDVRALAEHDPESHPPATLWALKVNGADRPGIVAELTGVLARARGSIVDLGTRLGENFYVLMADVELPEGTDVEALRAELSSVARSLGVVARFDPIDDDVL